MDKKKGRNFYLPGPISDVFEELRKPLKPKQKWIVISAAILALAEMSPEARGFYFGAISSADTTGSLDDLIERAKRGELAKEAMTGLITRPVRSAKTVGAR